MFVSDLSFFVSIVVFVVCGLCISSLGSYYFKLVGRNVVDFVGSSCDLDILVSYWFVREY